jgi:hypothetical protein
MVCYSLLKEERGHVRCTSSRCVRLTIHLNQGHLINSTAGKLSLCLWIITSRLIFENENYFLNFVGKVLLMYYS